jgi:hypothetical protein
MPVLRRNRNDGSGSFTPCLTPYPRMAWEVRISQLRTYRRKDFHRNVPIPASCGGRLDLRLERGFDRSVRRLNGDYARPGIGDAASLADALDLRTFLREFASA